MRFRCELGQEGLKVLLSVVQTMERADRGQQKPVADKKGIVCLSPREISVALFAEQLHGDMLAFATLSALGVCESYFVESAAANNVYFSVALKQLSRALGSAASSATTTVKLAKRQGNACLLVCFESSRVSSVEHAIPIKLARAAEVERYRPPVHGLPRVVFVLPQASTLKTLVDRLKLIAGPDKCCRVDVKFEAAGVLAFRVVSDAAVVKAFFTNLEIKKLRKSKALKEGETIAVAVDARNLAQALLAYNLDFHAIDCCPVENFALVIHVTLAAADNGEPLGDITYYIPLLDDGDDDDLERHQQNHADSDDDDDASSSS